MVGQSKKHDDATVPRVLWRPLPSSGKQTKDFMRLVNTKHNLSIQDYPSLWAWSTDPDTAPLFWWDLFEFLKIKSTSSSNISLPPWTQPGARPLYPPPSFFGDVKLNFAENIFQHYKPDETILHVVSEGSTEARDVTWKELRDQVAYIASAMTAFGVTVGDRVAVVMSNRQETVACCLAALSLGAIWSSSSPDMGVDGVLDRLRQIQPKLVFCEDEVLYNGKCRDLLEKHQTWASRLRSESTELSAVVVIAPAGRKVAERKTKMVHWNDFLAGAAVQRELKFVQLPFNQPAFIVYSSGTSGLPKCIVHSAGGLLMQVRKDSFLSYDIREGDTVLQYTTTGWIMWAMVLVSLSLGGKVVVYDGSPMMPDPLVLLRLVEKLQVNMLGTSAKFLSLLKDSGIKPREILDLSSLHTVTSTGSTLTAQVAEWFYDEGFPKNIHLISTCGGTDLACSLMTGSAIMPLYAGEIQVAALGMAVDIYETDSARPIRDSGQPGELVCTQPFPSQPVLFWGDESGEKYQKSYFEMMGNSVWNQGDFVSVNPATGGFLTHGRSDGVLNPSGVRFGSAEIYNVVEQDPTIADSLCIGQRRKEDSDETVLLFVIMADGVKFTRSVVERLKSAIRTRLSARHVPKYIFETPGIPYTINGKKVEIVVKKVVAGKDVQVSPTIANPECLDFYKAFVRVEEMAEKQEQQHTRSLL